MVDDSSILDLSETNDSGFLPPKMTTVQRDAIVAPVAGLMIFNDTTATWDYFTGMEWVSR